MQSTRYFCPILMKLGFSRQIFEKSKKYPISWKSFQCEPSLSMWTDERTWRSLYSIFEILWTRLKIGLLLTLSIAEDPKLLVLRSHGIESLCKPTSDLERQNSPYLPRKPRCHFLVRTIMTPGLLKTIWIQATVSQSLQIRLLLITQSVPTFSYEFRLFRFLVLNFLSFLLFPTHATCAAPLILPYLFTLIIDVGRVQIMKFILWDLRFPPRWKRVLRSSGISMWDSSQNTTYVE
jgi:hypothetical protein